MGAETKIAWCDHTFNPWLGCTRVSEGCRHCYAEQLVEKRMGLKRWGNSPRVRTKGPWREVLKWDREAREAGVRRRVFCASLADVFEDAPGLDEIRAEMWPLIAKCDALDWQLLTKRPENIVRMLPADWGCGWPHVWLGTSCENQETAARRIPSLLRAPAAVRFLSCEPLLGPINLRHLDVDAASDQEWCQIDALTGRHTDMARPCPTVPHVDWVIVGGESGPGARPCDVGWIRSIVEQCKAAGVACFMKQVGRYPCVTVPDRVGGLEHRILYHRDCGFWPADGSADRDEWVLRVRHQKGGDPAEWPEDLRVREFPVSELARGDVSATGGDGG